MDSRGEKAKADVTVTLSCDEFANDPLLVRQHIGLKMLLNAHSTCVMARLGRLTGNTMTNVSPANLKLVGRATYLIVMHVNEHLAPHGYQVGYAHVTIKTINRKLPIPYVLYSTRHLLLTHVPLTG